MVQTQAPTVKQTTFQESVITNTEAMDTKHTKKRKAMAAANAAAEFAAQAAAAAAAAAAQAVSNEFSFSYHNIVPLLGKGVLHILPSPS